MIIATLSSFFGTVWWTALVAVVAFTTGVAASDRVKNFLNRGK